MAEINLTQQEADALLAMEKFPEDDSRYLFPGAGQMVIIPLKSLDGREKFLLDISRGRIELRRIKFQNRARKTVILARLDLYGPLHRNPDGEEIPTPHLHLYCEGYGDKWAVPVPKDKFGRIEDEWETLNEFMDFCNISEPPNIQGTLLV